MRIGTKYILSTGAALAVALIAAPSFAAVSDGFGDVDRNNDGVIEDYDTDLDPLALPIAPNSDVGITWAATRGFTSSNTGDAKALLNIIDDSTGDVDSPGLQSGYALGVEAKGSGSSFAGFFDNSVNLGANVGDRVNFSFDFRIWTQSGNPTAQTPKSELRVGLFQDSDNQFGLTNAIGKIQDPIGAPGVRDVVTWGPDTGKNDGEWRNADPGPVGDKGYWLRLPLGIASSTDDGRLIYERNTNKFLEGSSVGCPTNCGNGDQDTVADAGNAGEGPGGRIIDLLGHNIMLSAVRTANSIELQAYLDGSLIMSDEIDPADPDVVWLGTPHDSYDYVAFRNTGTAGDWDYAIDNVSVVAVPIPEPASLALLGLGGLAVLRRR